MANFQISMFSGRTSPLLTIPRSVWEFSSTWAAGRKRHMAGCRPGKYTTCWDRLNWWTFMFRFENSWLVETPLYDTCPSPYSRKHNITWSPQDHFYKLSTKIHSDSRMNWYNWLSKVKTTLYMSGVAKGRTQMQSGCLRRLFILTSKQGKQKVQKWSRSKGGKKILMMHYKKKNN